METAVKYTEHMHRFTTDLLVKVAKSVEVKPGRRFDRVVVNGSVKYFVDRHSWEIFGAKSSFQYNPRRHYGKLDTVEQFNWVSHTPIPGTAIEQVWTARESEIVKNYKKRGRPKKNVGAP